MTTVSEYLIQRFSDLGIDKTFGIPGDFPFPILDAIEASETMQWIGCVNELNAAFSADGYARMRGAALLCNTYGVGELSAINGLMGSKAHRLPVFLVVGSPCRRIVHQKISTYHTLGDGVYGNHESIVEATCCVKVVLTPENAIAEIERAITVAFAKSAPAYIVVPQDVGTMPVIGRVSPGSHMREIQRSVSNPVELEAAVNAIVKRLQSSTSAVLLPSALTARYGLTDKVEQLITKTNFPFALAPLDKGFLDEGLPQFLGMYMGIESIPQGLQQIIETADLILDLGGHINEHVNTGFWTSRLPEQAHIRIHEDWVQIGEHVFVDVAMGELLDQLIDLAPIIHPPTQRDLPYELIPMAGKSSDPTSSAGFYPRLQRMLKPGDSLAIEAGSCELPLLSMRLPEGVRSQAQVLWSSIGWAGPAAMGIAIAEPNRRVVLVSGDGAHQETMGVIASMGFHDVKPIIFVLNNGTYGCENTIWKPGRNLYNDIAPIRYNMLPEAFGCRDWLCRSVSTIGELEDAITTIEHHPDQAAYIEVMIPAAENVPLPDKALDAYFKLRTPTDIADIA
jgi:indolepyruvate decarboxylase